MNRSNLKQGFRAFVVMGAAIAFSASLTAGAQIATPAKKVTVPAKAATAKPVAKTTSATTTTATQKTQSATPALTPASSQTVITPAQQTVATPATQTVMNPLSQTVATPLSQGMTNPMSQSVASPLSQTGLIPGTTGSTAGTSNPMSGAPVAGTSSAGPSSAGDARAPVGAQGIGTFLSGPWTMIVYGCFRSGTRLFCDFDTFNRNNVQANSNIWEPVSLVDDGGKITRRHNASFIGDDGSQFPTAYVTTKPVRFTIEYDDIDQRYTSISLVLGRDQITGVPITVEDASQPAGKIPARPSANTVQPR
jgi:hypothetical protein